MIRIKTPRSYFFLFILCIFSGVWTSCQTSSQNEAGQPLQIVATTGMIGDALRQIVQDKAEVTTLMGPGVDPHLYKPTPSDLQALRKADVIFYNGLHLEAKMVEVLEKMNSSTLVFPAGNALLPTDLNYPEGAALPDPHIWFNLLLWQKAVYAFGEQMGRIDTVNAAFYRSNAEAYAAQLAETHQWIQREIGSIPPQNRVLITAHDAFGYFGKAYNIEVEGLQGISTTAEFGLQDVANMVELIVNRKIKAVFVESAISDRSIKAVVAGCQEQGHEVTIGGTLYSDALGAEGTPEASFLGVVRHNVNTIVAALK